MKKFYIFLAEGFEEIEALGAVDVLRRAALPVVTVSVTGSPTVKSCHGVAVVADALFENCDFDDAALLYLPGGLPGATNLADHEGLRQLILRHSQAGRPLAAICAAPLVYGRMGLLEGHRATCYPGFEPELKGATCRGELFTEDAQFLLGKGPGAVLRLAYAIVARFAGAEKAREIYGGMLYPDAIEAGI